MAVGDPKGVDLVSGTTDGDTITFAVEEREISLGAGIELTSGKTYAIVVRAPDAIEAEDVHWVNDLSDNYANGARYDSTDSGQSWGIVSSGMITEWFKTKAGAAEKDTFTFADVGGRTHIYDTHWTAQTFLATSTYTITSVVLLMTKGSQSTPGTITVSIRATEVAFLPPVASGENTMLTVRRLVAAADNKIFYENI